MYVQHMLGLFMVAVCSLELTGMVYAYPALLPYIYNPSNEHHTRNMKRNEIVSFPMIEDDVMELEQLRSNNQKITPEEHLAIKRDQETTAEPDEAVNEEAAAVVPSEDVEETINHTNTLPDLERQLELATPLMSSGVSSSTTTTSAAAAATESKETDEGTQVEEPKIASKPPPPTPPQILEAPAPPAGKAFYGAARLAFGQNPEVLPTSSTSTTTTVASTTSATTSTTTTTSTAASPTTTTTTANGAVKDVLVDEDTETVITDIAGDNNEQQEIAEGEAAVSELAQTKAKAKNHLNKETIGDILIDQLNTAAKTTERRSSMQLSPKTAQSLLRNPNGQYSSFDMAQYVFWTGDEAGVARAVEELIDENLITRENALKFLRDIRLGIEFLQRSYANRIFPEELRQNHLKRNHIPGHTTASTSTSSTSTTTTTTSTTTEKPLPYLQLEQELELAQPEDEHTEHVTKSLEGFTFWNKLRELNDDGRQDLADYDDTAGRAKIVEYLYNEYTLEEILYKLAKVMFAQSLAHGSDEAQQELQKLTDFLERESNMGVIPIDLQKKVLRVLLTALSDTLSEHPELLPAARLNLANPYYRLPMHTPSH